MLTVAQALTLPKTVVLPERVRAKAHPSHRAYTLRLEAGRDDVIFSVYVRANVVLPESFSVGLVAKIHGVGSSVLYRVNGDHGPHRNPDGSRFASGPHRHQPSALDLDKPVSSVSWPEGPPHADVVDAPVVFTIPVAWQLLASACGIVSTEDVASVIHKVQTAIGSAQLTVA